MGRNAVLAHELSEEFDSRMGTLLRLAGSLDHQLEVQALASGMVFLIGLIAYRVKTYRRTSNLASGLDLCLDRIRFWQQQLDAVPNQVADSIPRLKTALAETLSALPPNPAGEQLLV